MEAGTSGDIIYDTDNGGAGSQTTVEIKIKTLDSQVYSCQVEQNTPVPALKEKIATLTGVPVESQRLICRGKVLKDNHLLSAYSVEDGHTLHLVTRHVPQPSPPSEAEASRNGGMGEDEGRVDSHAGARNRSGQVSHSVVLGTFNIPDAGDGGMTDVGRIIGSVLNSMGLSNLIPVNANASNGGSVAASIFPGRTRQQPDTEDQERVEAGSSIPQRDVDSVRPPSSLEQGSSIGVEPQFNVVHGLRGSSGFVGAIPATVPPRIRLIQQAMVVPDALTTLSQYLNRMEEVFAANGQQAVLTAPNSTTGGQSFDVSMHRDQQHATRGYPTAAMLGTIIHRTQGLLGNQAIPELLRLASQLENEPGLHDAAARGEVQSAALRDGTMMQHLGALLLELGRATLTLQMGSSPADAAVNAGPAVFISASGPNPMMVQPLPFQPGAGHGAFMPQPAVAAMVPSMGAGEAPRNVNIHIHAGDLGIPSALGAHPQTSLAALQVPQSGVVTSGPLLGSGFPPTSQGQNADASNGNHIPLMQAAVSASLQGGSVGFGEHGAVRVLPMRTLVAAVPAALHNRPPTESTGTTVGVFYPLLARFQQLNPAQLSQQTVLINGSPVGNPVPLGTAVPAQQEPPVSIPTMQAQVQLQAWAPSNDLVGGGQGMLEPVNFQGAIQLPLTSSASEAPCILPQQQSQSAGTDLVADRQMLSEESLVQSIDHVESAGAAAGNRLQNSGHVENVGQAVSGILHGSGVADLVGPILQQVVEAYEQAGVMQSNRLEIEVSVATEPVTQVDRIDVPRENSQQHEQDVGMHVKRQDVADNEQSKHTSTRDREVSDNERLPVLPSTDLIDSLSSRELSKEDNTKLQVNGTTNEPVVLGLGGLQCLPSRTQKRPYKQSHQQCPLEEGNSEQGVVEHSTLSINGGEQIMPNGGHGILCNLSSSLASPLEATSVVDSTGQIPEGIAQFLNCFGSSRQALGGHNCNAGEVISQLMATQSQGNLSQPTRGATDQGTILSSNSLGTMMGQHIQSPFMGNVLQQVGDEPRVFDNMLHGQGGLDLSGMLQQMMPIVSHAFPRGGSGELECNASSAHETESRPQDDHEATQDIGLVTSSDGQKEVSNQDELTQWNESVSNASEQHHSIQMQRPTSEVHSGSAPVAKRQKTQ
eukprot:c27622_g1_i1 orf=139-3600(+)